MIYAVKSSTILFQQHVPTSNEVAKVMPLAVLLFVTRFLDNRISSLLLK